MGRLLSRHRVRAVDGISFTIPSERAEILAVIGESGSGKTTLARMILNMLLPTEGSIRLRGTDLTGIRRRRERLEFMRLVQPIFQNPFEAFNPLKRIDRYLFMTARRVAGLEAIAAENRVQEVLGTVGLSLAEVSEVQQCPENTVKTRLFHARQKIKNCLRTMVEREGELPAGARS